MPKISTKFNGSIDLSAVQAAPPVVHTSIDLEPYKAVLRASWDAKQTNDPNPARQIVLPADVAKAAASRFRQAAASLNLGCAIDLSDSDSNGNVTLVVQARTKKARLSDAERASRQAERDQRKAEREAKKSAAAAKKSAAKR